MLGQPREPGKVGLAARQNRHADQIWFHRRHVRLTPPGPMHLDELRPRRHLEMPAHAVAPRCSCGDFDSDGPSHRRVQSVGTHQPLRPHTGGRHPVRVLLDGGHLRPDPFGVLLFGAGRQRGVQGGASHAPARAAAKQCLGPATFVDVRDPAKGHARRIHAERVSSASPPGIRPSPQALSIGPSRCSRHDHRKPRRRACNAVASPPGPPPTISRSVS